MVLDDEVKYVKIEETIWTKHTLNACLKRIVHKEVYTKILNHPVDTISTTEKFGNHVVVQYLQHLIKKPELRLQLYCKPYGEVTGLLFDLVRLQNLPLSHIYTNLPVSTYYDSTPQLYSCTSSDAHFYSPVDVILILYRFLKMRVGEATAQNICNLLFEKLKGYYELIPAKNLEKLMQTTINVERVDEAIQEYRDILKDYLFEDEELREATRLPIVRVFDDIVGKWSFAAEVEIAVMVGFKKRFPGKPLPSDWNKQAVNDDAPHHFWKSSVFVRSDNDEDRKLGIIHIIEIDTLEKLLKHLGMTMDDLIIVKQHDAKMDRHFISVPRISPYGSHCKLALQAFHELMDDVLLGMRLFQRVKRANFPKIEKWFNKLKDTFDNDRTYRYAIETWRIDKIMEEARRDLTRLATELIYNVPLKPSFAERELREILKKMSPILNIEHRITQYLKKRCPDSEYSYHLLFEAIVVGTTQRCFCEIINFKRFMDCHSSNPMDFNDDFLTKMALSDEIARHNMCTLPPSANYGKSDLGEVRAPKNKKNKKPDFSEKKDFSSALLDVLDCFNKHFENFQVFRIEKLLEFFCEESYEYLKDVFENDKEKMNVIEEVFDIKFDNGSYTLKRKTEEHVTEMLIEKMKSEASWREKNEELENDLGIKKDEVDQVNKQIADTVQRSVQKLRESKEVSAKEIEILKNELDESKKTTEENEKNSKTKISNIKQNCKDQVKTIKEESDAKEAKNVQLQEELRECREELRNQQERRNREIDENLRIMTERNRRLEVEVENLKLWKTAKTKEIEELTNKISHQETHIEILELKSSGEQQQQQELEEKDRIIEELMLENERLTLELRRAAENE